jgi:hypothetical protein
LCVLGAALTPGALQALADAEGPAGEQVKTKHRGLLADAKECAGITTVLLHTENPYR